MKINYLNVSAAMAQIAPPQFASSWDNVGLLCAPHKKRTLKHILLTIDLNQAVLNEALRLKATMIIAYHPPLFEPLHRLIPTDAKSSLILQCIEQGIALYSPHTALDAVPGGVNDWLADGFGSGSRSCCEPIDPSLLQSGLTKIVVFVPPQDADNVRFAMSDGGAGVIGHYSQCSFNLNGTGTFYGDEQTHPAVGKAGQMETVQEVRLEMVCPDNQLEDAITLMHAAHPYEEPAFDLYPLTTPLHPEDYLVGMGRLVELDKPVTTQTMVRRIKKHLGLKHVRLAASPDHASGALIHTAACVPGAGGSILNGLPAGLILTGEMRHHDILAANNAGTSVILTDHTNCERGYLPHLGANLADRLGKGVTIHISQEDKDPLAIV